MATIKSYTDLEQSKKLAEFLPLESADMVLWGKDFESVCAVVMNGLEYRKMNYIPCWSLAALLYSIPTMIGGIFEKDALRLRMDKSETDFNIWYENLDTGIVEEGFDIVETNPIDACVEMIIMLSKNGLI